MKIDFKNNGRYLEAIRDHVDKVLRGKLPINSVKQCTEMNLYKLCGGEYTFNVEISVPEPKQKTYIMCIGPDPVELEKRCRPLVEKMQDDDYTMFIDEWQDIPKWCIEIDKRTLTKGDPLCFDSGSQFVAVLCHELGHIQHKHPMFILNTYKMAKAKFSIYHKLFFSKGSSIAKLFIPLFVCGEGLRIIVKKPIADASELQADLSVPDQYKYDLVTYIENHIIPNGAGSDIIQTKEEASTDYEKGVEFSREAIFLMKQRRQALVTFLNTQYLLNPSNYYKTIYAILVRSTSGSDVNSKKVNKSKDKFIEESIIRESNEFEKQANTICEATHISEREIMVLSIRADNIKTPDDKVYIINTVYDYIEILEKQRAKAISKCKDANKLPKEVVNDPKLAELYKIRDKVMDTEVDDYGDRYGVFIKYPAGYEG